MLSLFMGLQVVAYAEPSESKDAAKSIKSSGCVETGAEAGCLVLKGLKDKKEYNLFFASGKKPSVGTAISFTGKIHAGPTTCMQGTPVDVTKWVQLRMHCPVPASAK